MKVPYTWLKAYIDTNLEPQEIARLLTMAGHALDKTLFQQSGDWIIEVEDRGNRADIMGLTGVARDLAALTKQELKEPPIARLPEINNQKFNPEVEIKTDKVIRWTAVAFKDVKVAASPPWLRKKLRAYGIEIVNNIVDITNYIMVEQGMPLHAFDADKISRIVLRPAKTGETLQTFEGTNLKLGPEDLVAADGQKPLTLTTTIGGQESGVTTSTKNVLIEAGLYHQPTARRSAIRHNLRNETSIRLGKYLHPHFCELAIGRTIYLIKEILSREPEPVAFDYYPENYKKQYAPKVIKLTPSRLNLIAGEEIPPNQASQILTQLRFVPAKGSDPKIESDPNFWVVPYFRTDVEIEEDLIEEVLRIRGYDKIPTILPPAPAPTKLYFPLMELEDQIRDIAIKLGFNEVIGQPIIDIKDSEKVGLIGSEWREKMVFLENSWNQELNLMRPEMISGQLKYLLAYQKHNLNNVQIFEIGKTYTQDKNKKGYEKYIETRKAVLTTNSDYFSLKSQVEALFQELGIRNYEFTRLDFLFKKSRGASIRVSGEEVGKIGEVKNSVLEKFNLEGPAAHAVFYVECLRKHTPREVLPPVTTKIENFVSEDKTFVVGEREEVGKILKNLKTKNPNSVINFVGFYQDAKLKKEGQKSISFNIKTRNRPAKSPNQPPTPGVGG